MRVLLASASPRRRQLLKTIFKDFDVVSPDVDEDYEGDTPQKTVKDIALRKLNSIKQTKDYDIIIACDTMVFSDNLKIGKPVDEMDALRILKLLNGKTHTVITGVAIYLYGEIITDCESSFVTFKHLDDKGLADYIKNHDVLDKAGAYGIQDDVLVDNYRGDYANIVGLPIKKLQKMLRI